jgi:hypothetical protein
MHPALARVDHRPWPLPPGRWTWRQSWCDLLFAHWPVPHAALRPHVPAGLTLEEFDGAAWIGVVPFRMEGVMRRPLPDLPGLSAFPELNVRTYVERDGRPGVWFLSLDAANRLAVWAARRFFHLPYHFAAMSLRESSDDITYMSRRRAASNSDTAGESENVRFEATYRLESEVYESQPGTLEHWLTERYCLYAQSPDGALHTTDVHHLPWPLQKASAEIAVNEMLRPWRIELPDVPPLLHFARRLDVIVWSSRRL